MHTDVLEDQEIAPLQLEHSKREEEMGRGGVRDVDRALQTR